jgi:hypothetical protein
LSFNIPPALLNSEIDLRLPCTEKEWTAATPEAWADHHKLHQIPEAAFSTVLQSLLSQSNSPAVPCSTGGGYIMLHAILQQVWHTQQASPDRPAELAAAVETALKKWQAMCPVHPEFSPPLLSPYDPLAFNSDALLRLAYVRLVADFSRLRATLMGQNINAISRAMSSYPKNVNRSPATTKAVSYAIDALVNPMRLGLYPPTKGSKPPWSLQHHLFSLECCQCYLLPPVY